MRERSRANAIEHVGAVLLEVDGGVTLEPPDQQ